METSFEVLNDILTGEHLAIERYQAYIDALPASPLRNHLVAILTDHKGHAQRIAYFIQTNGGHVEEGRGWRGRFSLWQTKLKNMRENRPLEMLNELYGEENEGLTRAKERAQRYLSASEQEMMDAVFADEEHHLRQLQRLKEDLLQ
ncbi:Ferritin-related protein [Acididesulfobacillus acetoxydans]|uniref:Ferritin-like superfamily n=1 Tax=Acididesulfobacillus acetoxydans TaxID=1561005 RepID=A0A8S0X4Y0_9FIRM|nr:ferritin-like domain-containing protein [Acididesulfobacillus acetoxydans]CAA7601170.1 Ferritin-related protein [Acididesulfobacillus acetoxydans]CEJ08551.1 Ferritin-like superfamily [Acididesulfobacillus acetoxydans]